MINAAWRDLGPLAGACTVCHVDGELRLGEARTARGVRERLLRRYGAPATRLLSCGACSWRWIVRSDDTSDDTTAAGVAARRPIRVERRIPPPGRDWAYPAA